MADGIDKPVDHEKKICFLKLEFLFLFLFFDLFKVRWCCHAMQCKVLTYLDSKLIWTWVEKLGTIQF